MRLMKIELAKQVADKKKEQQSEVKAEEKYACLQKELLKEDQEREKKKH